MAQQIHRYRSRGGFEADVLAYTPPKGVEQHVSVPYPETTVGSLNKLFLRKELLSINRGNILLTSPRIGRRGETRNASNLARDK